MIDSLVPILYKAAMALENKNTPATKESANTLYIHWDYHPHGLQRGALHKIFNDTLSQSLDFTKMQVAISRPKNLRDALTRTELSLPNNFDLNEVIEGLRSSDRSDGSV